MSATRMTGPGTRRQAPRPDGAPSIAPSPMPHTDTVAQRPRTPRTAERQRHALRVAADPATLAGARLARRRRELPLGWVLSALIVLLFLLAWQAATWIWHLEAYVLPTPLEVAQAFGQAETRALILDNLGMTVREAMAGFGLCLVIGIGLAMAMFASRIMRDALYPLLIASQAVPTIAIGAVLVVALGYGPAPKIAVVVLYAFFAVTVSVYDSLQSLDPELPALLRTLGATPWQVWRMARLPAALPGFFTGAKLAITYSISGAIYGEWVGATGGLGYALQMASNQLASATVLAIVVVMAALGLLGFAVVALLERLLVPWARNTTTTESR